ncbi:MAG: hypothetical protein ACRCXZ_08425 [Patescibacteria group bacterium]
MLNFKKYTYDVFDQNFNVLEKKISRLKLETEITKNRFQLVKEYISPRINAVLPKEYTLKDEYYIFNSTLDDSISFNQEYFEYFVSNQMNVEQSWNLLHKKELDKQRQKIDSFRLKNMPGFHWKNLFYFFSTSIIIFGLFFNFVSSPWSNEILGDKSTSLVVNSEFEYKGGIRSIVLPDKSESMLTTKKPADEGNFFTKNAQEQYYELCRIKDTKKTFILIISRAITSVINECSGSGVSSPINYPKLTLPVTELSDNEEYLKRLNMTKGADEDYEVIIKAITTNLDLEEPKFMIFKDSILIDQKTVNSRVLGLVFLTLLPILFALFMIIKQELFKRKLNKLK